jgi:hypothetical protein
VLGSNVGSNQVLRSVCDLRQQIVHLLRSVPLGILVNVLVHVLREPNVRVSNDLGDHLIRHALSPQERNASVAQIRGLDVVPGLKDIRLSKLTLQRVQQFFNDKLKAGNSPSLVRYLRVVLRLPLNEAVKSDLVPRNVAALV